MRVEILYFDGCPNHHGARELVQQVSSELGVAPEIRMVEVADLEAAERLRFLGSPSVRVDGCDVEPGADAHARQGHQRSPRRTLGSRRALGIPALGAAL